MGGEKKKEALQRVFPVALSLSSLLAADLQRFTQSQSSSGAFGSPHVGPKSLPFKRKCGFSPQKKYPNWRRGCGVSFALPPSLARLLFSFLSPFSRCELVACYGKEIVLLLLLLLLASWWSHSPPPIFRSLFERRARQPAHTRSVPQCFHTFTGGRCV